LLGQLPGQLIEFVSFSPHGTFLSVDSACRAELVLHDEAGDERPVDGGEKFPDMHINWSIVDTAHLDFDNQFERHLVTDDVRDQLAQSCAVVNRSGIDNCEQFTFHGNFSFWFWLAVPFESLVKDIFLYHI